MSIDIILFNRTTFKDAWKKFLKSKGQSGGQNIIKFLSDAALPQLCFLKLEYDVINTK